MIMNKMKGSSAVIFSGALVLASSIALYIVFVRQDKRRKKLPPMAPTPWYDNIFIVGYPSLVNRMKNSDWTFNNHSQNTCSGTIYRESMPLPFPFIICCDYKLARILLVGNNERAEAEKSPGIRVLDIYPGIGSILTFPTSNGERAKARKFMMPAFSNLNLHKTALVMLEQKTCQFLQKLEVASKTDEVLNMKEEIVDLIFVVLSESLFDLPIDGSGGDLEGFNCQEFMAAQNASMKEAVRSVTNPFRPLMFLSESRREAFRARAKLIELGSNVLRRYRDRVAANLAASSDKDQPIDATIIGHLVRMPYASEEHRISDLMTFMIAGHETTAHSITFLLYCIARYPEVKVKVQKELAAVVGSGNCGDGTFQCIGQSELAKLEYLSWCIKETQRLYPVAPVVGRQVSDELEFNNMHIPGGSVILVHLYAMGRQKWIHEAESYIPERWDPNPSFPPIAPAQFPSQLQELKEISLPFSIGKRSCVGQNLAMMELKAVVATLIRYFDFTLPEDHVLDLELFVTLKPVDLNMTVSRRQG